MSFKFKVELELTEEQLQKIADTTLADDVDEVKSRLTDLATELSDFNQLENVIDALDLFNY